MIAVAREASSSCWSFIFEVDHERDDGADHEQVRQRQDVDDERTITATVRARLNQNSFGRRVARFGSSAVFGRRAGTGRISRVVSVAGSRSVAVSFAEAAVGSVRDHPWSRSVPADDPAVVPAPATAPTGLRRFDLRSSLATPFLVNGGVRRCRA